MKIPKQRIQQLFQIQSNRAVDIIFSQKKPEQLHEFYASLQQVCMMDNTAQKNNTILLKKTLENNYQKMLYCADLLEKVRKYADAVRGVASMIEGCVQEGGLTGEGKDMVNGKDGLEKGNVIASIERLARKGKFREAMCASFTCQGGLSESQRYYLFYLRIEIIQKMQRQLCLQKLDETRLQEYQKCLQQFLLQRNNQQTQIREQVQKQTQSFPPHCLLGLIHKHLCVTPRTIPFQPSLLLQILFEYKLSTLKNKHKTEHSAAYFEQYFKELGTIINLYKKTRQYKQNIQNQQSCSLKHIYRQCVNQVKKQLSAIFIYRAQNGQIVFRRYFFIYSSQLYEELIRSQKFQAVIQDFSCTINNNGEAQMDVENPITFIKQLWHDYFVNLIDLLLDQTHPLARIDTLKQHLHPYAYIPGELLAYLHDHSLEQSLQIIRQYSDKLKLLKLNLQPIIKKCNKQELKTLSNKLSTKIKELLQKCSQYIHKTMSQNQSHTNEGGKQKQKQKKGENKQNVDGLKLRKYVLLKILVGMLETLIKRFNVEFDLSFDEECFEQLVKFVFADKVWAIFVARYPQNYYIAEPLIDFDCFFIGYLEGTSVQLHPIIIQVISEITLQTLSYLQSNPTNRHENYKEKDAIKHTLQSLKEKKEKITILDKIALPYIGKNIFKCVMKPIQMDRQFYENNFVCKAVESVVSGGSGGDGEEFEIGEKEEKDEFVRVNNIGKSLMSLGNNLITGFMKKK